MSTVRRILQHKQAFVWTIAPDSSVFDALQLMAAKEVGALVVVENGLVVGLFSERDYARKLILQGKFSRDTRVADIMTRRVVIVQPENTIEECMALMTEQRIRHLPVLDRSQLVGIISIGDLVKEIISEQRFMIGQLENYIMDGWNGATPPVAR